jgi:Zn-dependent alcohol dehydrogenase
MGLIRNLFPRLYDDTERQVTSLMRDINKAFEDIHKGKVIKAVLVMDE